MHRMRCWISMGSHVHSFPQIYFPCCFTIAHNCGAPPIYCVGIPEDPTAASSRSLNKALGNFAERNHRNRGATEKGPKFR